MGNELVHYGWSVSYGHAILRVKSKDTFGSNCPIATIDRQLETRLHMFWHPYRKGISMDTRYHKLLNDAILDAMDILARRFDLQEVDYKEFYTPPIVSGSAQLIAAVIEDCYSADSFENFAEVCQLLLDFGLSEVVAASVACTRLTRWIVDESSYASELCPTHCAELNLLSKLNAAISDPSARGDGSLYQTLAIVPETGYSWFNEEYAGYGLSSEPSECKYSFNIREHAKANPTPELLKAIEESNK